MTPAAVSNPHPQRRPLTNSRSVVKEWDIAQPYADFTMELFWVWDFKPFGFPHKIPVHDSCALFYNSNPWSRQNRSVGLPGTLHWSFSNPALRVSVKVFCASKPMVSAANAAKPGIKTTLQGRKIWDICILKKYYSEIILRYICTHFLNSIES